MEASHDIVVPSDGEVVLYQPDNEIRLEVRLKEETVWLNRQQMAMLFGRDVKTIGKHINNALQEELSGLATVAKFAIVQNEGGRWVSRSMEFYNLDMVLSVGYRVKSEFNKAHDRFLLIDNEVYHIGASIKDLGKKWFAFTLMHDIKKEDLINKIQGK